MNSSTRCAKNEVTEIVHARLVTRDSEISLVKLVSFPDPRPLTCSPGARTHDGLDHVHYEARLDNLRVIVRCKLNSFLQLQS